MNRLSSIQALLTLYCFEPAALCEYAERPSVSPRRAFRSKLFRVESFRFLSEPRRRRAETTNWSWEKRGKILIRASPRLSIALCEQARLIELECARDDYITICNCSVHKKLCRTGQSSKHNTTTQFRFIVMQ